MRALACLLVLLALAALPASSASAAEFTRRRTLDSGVVVQTDADLFAAICDNTTTLITLGASLDLREENWPKECAAPVRLLNRNLTISGPLEFPIRYIVNFNFMARKVVIQPYGEVRLRHFTARNTRRGGGGEIDFIAFSPKGILWTDDLNKNQIVCLHADAAKLVVLPLPAGFPEFASSVQMVELWDGYCATGTCWKEVLHYQQFYTDVNVGSDSETGGYVMAKRNSSKTCDAFVNDTCIAQLGGEACMANVINAFLAALPPLSGAASGDGKAVNKLAIALPVALGGAAVIALVAAVVLVVRRRRTAAAAEAAAIKGGKGDVEEAGNKGLGQASKGADSVSSGSKLESHASGGTAHRLDPGGGGVGTQPHHATAQSFGYASADNMGAHLGGTRASSSAASLGAVLVEGLCDDGSTCTFSIGPTLGQGSFGVVFKGVWQDQPVAVKVILSERSYSEQVSNEIRLMTSAECRHPNLLRAHTCMTRARLVHRQHPAAQALEASIMSLTSRARSDGSQQQHQYGSAGRDSAHSAEQRVTLAETWIVSELCNLGSLAQHVHADKRFLCPPARGGRPLLGGILACLRDIAAGMAHLHALNVVHGDLKLANVLLSSQSGPPEASQLLPHEGGSGKSGDPGAGASQPSSLLWELPPGPLPADVVAKVADFGLSRWLKEGQTHHSTKTLGTVTHMPPELLRNGKLTLSGDVYSFGILMWETLTGSVPYKGLMYGEVVERVVVSHRRPQFPAHTPGAYRALAERCWAADAAARPPFAEVLAALQALAAPEAAAALQAESDAVPLPPPGAAGSTASAQRSTAGSGATGSAAVATPPPSGAAVEVAAAGAAAV